eukprot:m51a1_g11252 putative adenylate guanylate cyclase (354) ;mRNA; r:41975-46629
MTLSTRVLSVATARPAAAPARAREVPWYVPRLRGRLLLSSSATLAAASCAVVAAVLVATGAALRSRELREAVEQMRLFHSELLQQVPLLQTVLQQWACWDDTYAYMAAGVPEGEFFVHWHSDNTYLRQYQLTSMLYFDASGNGGVAAQYLMVIRDDDMLAGGRELFGVLAGIDCAILISVLFIFLSLLEMVFRRIRSLTASITEVLKHPSTESRVNYSGRDELADIAASVNFLLHMREVQHDTEYASQIVRLAMALRECAAGRRFGGQQSMRAHVGISSGPCSGGIIGKRQWVYDLWSDTVNTASRLKSRTQPGEILCCQRTYELAGCAFRFGESVQLSLKGKGVVVAYPLDE